VTETGVTGQYRQWSDSRPPLTSGSRRRPERPHCSWRAARLGSQYTPPPGTSSSERDRGAGMTEDLAGFVGLSLASETADAWAGDRVRRSTHQANRGIAAEAIDGSSMLRGRRDRRGDDLPRALVRCGWGRPEATSPRCAPTRRARRNHPRICELQRAGDRNIARRQGHPAELGAAAHSPEDGEFGGRDCPGARPAHDRRSCAKPISCRWHCLQDRSPHVGSKRHMSAQRLSEEGSSPQSITRARPVAV